ncbi:hypothetical protein [Streptomyces sp. NPDC007355]|uniref:hypothetical protein n=1 Tax=Streptomyces sp. NPDC007355 TaxID=3364778 RepID=UPI0036C1C5A5
MSSTTPLVLLLLFIAVFFALAAPVYLIWRHPRLGVPLGVSTAFGTLCVAAVAAALKL